MITRSVAAFRLLIIVIITLLALPAYAFIVAIGFKGHSRYSRAYWSSVARLMGFTIRIHGTPLNARPALFVSNHASYLDIIVLGSIIPGCFVAKTEVSGWPGVGMLSRIAQTVFVDRKRGGSAKERDQIRRRLEGGEQLILFPEGTSNDGNSVLPFKSSLFSVAELLSAPGKGSELPVQPVSVAYTGLDGMPLQRAFRPFYAWYGDMTLAGHLFTVLGLGKPTVDVIFHPPVTLAGFSDRKTLSSYCHEVVRQGVVLALAGRLPENYPDQAA